ncbi:Na+/H+ antiporter NhaA [Falsirhodobacter sp. 1013]|uniref:Na+/H+ antiporter NhaA n=1 Tax=Falsirhodobacter sp. 1013 TaxID=3417566 RepID=UPI003EBCB8CE
MTSSRPGKGNLSFRTFLQSESAGGIILMVTAVLAILVANSPLHLVYSSALHAYLGPLSVQHWINDALMAVFFLMVGLEIKREMTDGQLSTWPRRILPGVAALFGMAVPALIYITINRDHPEVLRGWAIPSATDIAFALGVLSLLGPRVPVSLKIFLAALAIIDDLGAVVVIALFYTSGLSVPDLIAAALVIAALLVMNRGGIRSLWPYLLLGAILWVFVFRSGVHATLAGVILALCVPIQRTPGAPEAKGAISPLHRLEQALHTPVAFIVVPIFGFANAGVSLIGVDPSIFTAPATLGVAFGLFFGKLIGVFGAVALLVIARVVDLPADATWRQVLGVSILCGIGFTMSLFIGLLAFDDPIVQEEVKIGILMGSILSGLVGYAILATSPIVPRRKAG